MRVSRLISAAVLAAVAVIMSGGDQVPAQSRAGGLPAVSDRGSGRGESAVPPEGARHQVTLRALQTALTNLETKVTTLQTALASEIAARQAADKALQAATDNLQVDLDSETFFRKGQDFIFNAALTSLGARLDTAGTFYKIGGAGGGLDHGQTAEVASLGPVPPGNYLVIGRVELRNTENNANWQCRMYDSNGVHIDTVDASTSVLPGGAEQIDVTLVGTATFTAPTFVGLGCQGLIGTTGHFVGPARLLVVKIGTSG